MKNKTGFILILFLAFIVTVSAQEIDVKCVIDDVENRYAPDKRVVLSDIQLIEKDGESLIEGVTNNPYILEELQSKLANKLEINVRLLPDEVVGEKSWGVVANSVEKLYKKRAYHSEIVTEVLLGTPLKLLDKKSGWYRVQTPDGYIAWYQGLLQPMTEEELDHYKSKSKIILTALSSHSYNKANLKSQIVSDLVNGNIFEFIGTKKKFYQVRYPDGREAFVLKTDALKLDDWLNSREMTGSSIVETSFQFMGLPYVWGGTSTKGIDCSGFTKSVYFNHGVVLPRDASQQVHSGVLVDDKGDFSKLQTGDLIFFGSKADDEHPTERVVHVAIYIGNMRFIHASSNLRINSFDPADPLYDAYNTNRYLRTKRILGSDDADKLGKTFKDSYIK